MSLVALMSGVLNSLGKFVESSAVSIVLNLTLMAAMLLSLALGYGNDRTAGIIQAWGIFAAGILHLLLLIDGVRRNGMLLRLRRPRMTEGVRRLVALGIPGVIAGGVTQINIVIGGMIASFQQGAVSLSLLCRPPVRAAPCHHRHRHRRRVAARYLPTPARRRRRRREWTARTARWSLPCCSRCLRP